MIAQTLSISSETAKKELGFWVSHGVIKESELQRSVGCAEDSDEQIIQTEIVFYASKTLDRKTNGTSSANAAADEMQSQNNLQERDESSYSEPK